MTTSVPPLARARRTATLLIACSALAAPEALAQDLIIQSGTTFVFDTGTSAQLRLNRLIIENGATLRVVGPRAFSVTAAVVVIDGTLDASGLDSEGVGTLNTTNQPEPGAPGVAGGGSGGTGSPLTMQSTPGGQNGFGSFDATNSVMAGGGGGGESSFHSFDKDARRGAGGGGGALAVGQPVVMDPLDPQNLGLIATSGFDGGAAGTGAISGMGPAQGGAAGVAIFMDADPTNNFWGQRLVGGSLIVGETGRPFPGRGGGAGGDAVRSATFPSSPFSPTGDEKGAGGGGGGGLVLILARKITIGPSGHLIANGGTGGGGENVTFFDRVGGGSGGGSGGWIVLEALQIDFSLAGDDAVAALGGRGGAGRNNVQDVVGAGGNGGPGVIQLHTWSGTEAEILLPAGKTVDDLTTPNGVVLLPALSR